MYVLSAIASLATLGLILGWILAVAAKYLKVETNPIVQELEALMPGSQCGQCGYPGCKPAAEALARGEAPVTLCPPGGSALAEQFAALLGVTVDLSGFEEPEMLIAKVSEATCTGCRKCVDVCPTECLQMHRPEVTLRNWRWHKPSGQPTGATA